MQWKKIKKRKKNFWPFSAPQGYPFRAPYLGFRDEIRKMPRWDQIKIWTVLGSATEWVGRGSNGCSRIQKQRVTDWSNWQTDWQTGAYGSLVLSKNQAIISGYFKYIHLQSQTIGILKNLYKTLFWLVGPIKLVRFDLIPQRECAYQVSLIYDLKK